MALVLVVVAEGLALGSFRDPGHLSAGQASSCQQCDDIGGCTSDQWGFMECFGNAERHLINAKP
jgi:hypothetical protein